MLCRIYALFLAQLLTAGVMLGHTFCLAYEIYVAGDVILCGRPSFAFLELASFISISFVRTICVHFRFRAMLGWAALMQIQSRLLEVAAVGRFVFIFICSSYLSGDVLQLKRCGFTLLALTSGMSVRWAYKTISYINFGEVLAWLVLCRVQLHFFIAQSSWESSFPIRWSVFGVASRIVLASCLLVGFCMIAMSAPRLGYG